MKTTAATFRNVFCFLSLLSFSVALVACGGGGGGTSSISSGSASVSVALAAAPGFPAGTSFTATPTAVDVSSKPVSPSFDNVWVKIEKVALLPSKEGEGPDPEGEVIATAGGPGPDGTFVSSPVTPPVWVNLRDLPSGQKIARFLNKFFNVPAGTYGKIRVYYSALYGERDTDDGYEKKDFHPTANSHFDVHFVGGDLVIPVTTDPAGGVRLYDVTIEFVGLKIVENKNKVLMRPQVFATVGAVQYVISGIVDNVDKTVGAFDISTAGGRSIHAMFDDANWAFKDNATTQQVDVDNSLGIAALRDGSLVDIYGAFTGIDTLFADNVVIIFTDLMQNTVAPGDTPPSGWRQANALDFFELRFAGDNVVIPRPSRNEARYDNNANLSQTFSDAIIVDNTCVRARGYFATEGIEAFWISWVSNMPCAEP
jgi:hypothetical protein